MTQNATNPNLVLPSLFCFLSFHHFIQEREMPCTTIQSLDDEFIEIFEKMGWEEFWDLSNVKGVKFSP